MTELIVAVVIIVVICLCLGFDVGVIALGFSVLLTLFVVVMLALFFYSIVRIAVSEKTSALFVRVDKNSRGKFSSAYYIIDGAEYPCAFPAEIAFRDMIYKSERPRRVLFDRKKSLVYDASAITTCVVGLLFSIAFCVAAVYFYFGFFGSIR